MLETQYVSPSREHLGLGPTHTSALLITFRGRVDQQLGKIASLAPLDEHRRAFRLLIAADRRQRHVCTSEAVLGASHHSDRGA
ncbi:DUF5958 family protein, partial [Streptomyces olivaceoviridis]